MVVSHLAIAIKCNTALVDPPNAMTVTIALCSDFGVIISRGFKSIFNNLSRYSPAKRHSSNFNGSSAGVDELKRKGKKEKYESYWSQTSTRVSFCTLIWIHNSGDISTCKVWTFLKLRLHKPLY